MLAWFAAERDHHAKAWLSLVQAIGVVRLVRCTSPWRHVGAHATLAADSGLAPVRAGRMRNVL
jgi:hypothetical protein